MMTTTTPVLGDNPTNGELITAIQAMREGGAVGSERDTDGNSWAIAIARHLNNLGPDPTDRYGTMRYERVRFVANLH